MLKLFLNNTYRRTVIIGAMAMFLILLIVFLAQYKKTSSQSHTGTWTKGQVLSQVDYRIFACGEEIFIKADRESLVGEERGLFARSKSGSIIAEGKPLNTEDVSLSAFFNAVGGALEFSDENERSEILLVPTESGLREFRPYDLCNGKKAKLYVLHYRVDATEKPWSLYPRILWKYFDYVLENNFGKVPPGDCLVFLFDSEDVLQKPWPSCASHDKAIADGKLILEK